MEARLLSPRAPFREVGRTEPMRLALCLLPVFLLLLLPTRWNSNEEGYFQYAHQFAAPEQFSVDSAIFDRSWARAAFMWPVGRSVEAFGYETVWAMARVGMAVLYAGAFGVFFAALGVGLLESIVIIGFFGMAGESLMGGEWLFRGVEAKTVAYAAVVAGMGFLARRRFHLVIAAAVLATYAHFLVGAFWAAAIPLLAWFSFGSRFPWRRYAVVVPACVLPLVGVIAAERFGVQTGVETASAYAMRNMHHVAPFASLWETWRWIPGIVGALALAVAMVLVARSDPDDPWPRFVSVLLGYLVLALTISYADRGSYSVAAFYIFRPSALTLFLALMTLLRFAQANMSAAARPAVLAGLVALAAPYYVGVAQAHAENVVRGHPPRGVVDLRSVVQELTNAQEVVLIEPPVGLDQIDAILPRYLERPTYVSHMFPSTHPTDAQEWVARLAYVRRLFAKGCEEPLRVPAALMVARTAAAAARLSTCGEVVWRRNETAVVRVSDGWRQSAVRPGTTAPQREGPR